MTSDWPPISQAPAPAPGWAQVFLLPLDLPEGRLAGLRGLLDAQELARAERFLPDDARRRFIAAHGQARQVLGSCLGRPPDALRFVTSAHGKPSLDGGGLRFNLSHSAGLGLLAVAPDRELGVDIEDAGRPVDFLSLARRFFAPAEAQALLALPPGQQQPAFFDAWTRKEALLKALGSGFSIPLDSFEVSLVPGDPPRASLPGWELRALAPAPGFTGALAVESPLAGLRCWRWAVVAAGEQGRAAPGRL